MVMVIVVTGASGTKVKHNKIYQSALKYASDWGKIHS